MEDYSMIEFETKAGIRWLIDETKISCVEYRGRSKGEAGPYPKTRLAIQFLGQDDGMTFDENMVDVEKLYEAVSAAMRLGKNIVRIK
jgi:hypothetical protein